MKCRFNKKSIIIPFIYLLAIFGLLLLQYSGNVSFKESYDRFEFSANMQKGEANIINQFKLDSSSYQLEYSESNPFFFLAENGERKDLILSEYLLENGNVVLDFEDQLSLEIYTTDGVLNYNYILKDGYDSFKYLVVPFRLARTYSVETYMGIPSFFFHSAKDDYVLNYPLGSYLDENEGFLYLALNRGPVLVSDSLVPQNLSSIDYKIRQIEVSDETFLGLLDSFKEKAYSGWLSDRFDRIQGTWQLEDSYAFSNAVARSLTSEAISRDSEESVLLAMNYLRNDVFSAIADYTLVPLLGDVVEASQDYIDGQTSELNEIKGLINRRDPELFAKDFLYARLASGSNRSLLSSAMEEGSAGYRSYSLEQKVGFLNFLADFFRFEGSQEAENLIGNLYSDLILNNLIATDEGIYLVESNKAPSFLNIKAGALFLGLSENEQFSFYAGLGRLLMYSFISEADGSGIIPKEAIFRNGSLSDYSGKTMPEDVYSFLPDTWANQIISTGSAFQEDCLVLTAADYEFTQEEDSFTMSFTFPLGKTHYVVITNPPTFTRVQMHNLSWNPDPYFTRYSDGWYYSRAKDTLYIKMRQRTEVEDFIFYTN